VTLSRMNVKQLQKSVNKFSRGISFLAITNRFFKHLKKKRT
jgi:hypothetical protein